jgi:hypothetical protein
MNHDDEQYLKLGKMVAQMIHDVRKATGDEIGYGRRSVTFPGGEVQLFVVKGSALALTFEAAAARTYAVESVTPKSQTH